MRRTLLAALCTAATAIALTTPASAGEFSVFTCFDDPVQEGLAFDPNPLAAPGMAVSPRCNRSGPGVRGMVTANTTGRRPAARGAVARATVHAPAGTSFSQLRWWGKHRRADCRYAHELFADDGAGGNVGTVQKLAPRHDQTSCIPKNHKAQVTYNADPRQEGNLYAAGDPTPQWWPIAGTTRIVQQVKCAAPRGQRCSRRSLDYQRTAGLVAVVSDPQPPSVAISADGDLQAGKWVNGTHQLTSTASDNVGIRAIQAVVLPDSKDAAEKELGKHNQACATVQPRAGWPWPAYRDEYPCGDRNTGGAIPLDTSVAVEGTRTLVLRATDAADNVSSSAPLTVRIDRTPPAKVGIEVEGGQGWHNAERFAITWVNPAEGDAAPIDGVYYQTRPAGGTEWSQPQLVDGSVSRLELRAPEGQTELRLWRRDAAGNQSVQLGASDPVTFRYDGTAPELGFEAPAAEDPTRVTVAVNDKVSGVAGGAIEMRRQGTDSWLALPTQLEGGRLVARIDDAALAAGPYLLRARAVDLASNEASTDRRLDGQPMMLNLPLRIGARLSAGVERTKTVRRTVRRHGKQRRVRRKTFVFESQTRARVGASVEVTGALTNQAGQALAGQQIQVYSRSPISGTEQAAGVVTTDAAGRYVYTLTADSSRTLRFVYEGAAVTLPSQSEVQLLVPGATTLKASRRRILNGQTVRFRGQVRSLPIPAAGKIVELQVYQGRKDGWTTFRTLRTDAVGRWRQPYTFSHTVCLDRWKIRARLPKEAGYPFEDGVSRPVRITVRGRCGR
jgi:hypothetical protein